MYKIFMVVNEDRFFLSHRRILLYMPKSEGMK